MRISHCSCIPCAAVYTCMYMCMYPTLRQPPYTLLTCTCRYIPMVRLHVHTRCDCPLSPPQRKSSGVGGAQRHGGSAPSLVSPSPEPSPPHATAQLDATSSGSGGGGSGGGWGGGQVARQPRELEPVPRARQQQPPPPLHSSSSGDLRPRRLVALHDSPLTQHGKPPGRKSRRRSPNGTPSAALQSTPSSTHPPPKQSMAVH